jgi:hypothetical protein
VNGKENKPEYKITNIPSALMLDANAVVRKNIINFTVKSESKAVKKVTTAITIFNQDGRDFSELLLSYDQFHKVKNIEGYVFDENGINIKELSSDDIKDYSDVSKGTVYEDSRIKKIELYSQKFPYTVEFSYEVVYYGYVGWPSWINQESLDAVEYSKFEIVLPSEMKLRYWCNQDTVKPSITTEDDDQKYVWESKELKKLSSDVYGDDYEDYATVVYIAPAKFEIDDTEGDMTSWKSFGSWYAGLIKEKEFLPEKAVNEVRLLVAATNDVHKKIEILYKYLQKHNRYISVQLGLGKWQPYDAKYVYEHCYGDCKALSNYMVALLKQIDITAYPVLIRNGNARFTFIEEFPNQMFNHVIVCVPMQQDTIWLECTSTVTKCGEIGSGNENRLALLIKPEGGVVVKTPKSSSKQNRQIRKCNASLLLTGEVRVNSEVSWAGNQEHQISSLLEYTSSEDQERWIERNISVPGLNVESYKFFNNAANENIHLKLKISLPRYATVSSNRIFIQPNIMEKRSSTPAEVTRRFSPIKLSYPYLDIDTVRYTIPDGYVTETLPSPVELSTSFGKFHSKTILSGNNEIIYTRSIDMFNYSIPAKDYFEYRKFIQSIVASDRAKAVLIKR